MVTFISVCPIEDIFHIYNNIVHKDWTFCWATHFVKYRNLQRLFKHCLNGEYALYL